MLIIYIFFNNNIYMPHVKMVCPIKSQRSWDNIKSTFCNKIDVEKIISPEMLLSYIKSGWSHITDKYKEGKTIKGRTLPVSPGKERRLDESWDKRFDGLLELEQTLALEMLGSIRKYLVERMFRCASGMFSTCDNEYVAFGSTNVTSDYDLSIMGPDANEIMWNMFKQFLQHYGQSLPYALDSNMYCGPLYTYITPDGKALKINPAINDIRLNYTNRHFTFIPQDQDGLDEQLTFACIKLIPLKHLLPQNSSLLNKYIPTAENYKTYLDSKKRNYNDDILSQISQGHSDPYCLDLIRSYYLQYLSGKICAKYIYGEQTGSYGSLNETVDGKEKMNIGFYTCQESYYSSEAYYTSAAVNCVVVEMQQWKNKKSLDWRDSRIKAYSYLTAAIENIGDLYNHSRHESGNVEKIIIKYSKYIYRIYNILGKISIGGYAVKAKMVEENIIPIRATYDMEEAKKHWHHLDYNPNGGEEKTDYMDRICKMLLGDINDHLKKWEANHQEMIGGKNRTRRKRNKKGKKTRKKY
jgi:hypothetical protein